MDYFQSIRVFAKVVEVGGFARTALLLNMSPATATRHIAELESHLGIRLLNRTTRHVSLTEAGQEYLQRVLQILGDVAEADAFAKSKSESPTGTLHIYSHLSFGETQLSRLLSAFKRECADIALDVTVSDRTLDLVEDGFDIGFFLSLQKFGSTMIARQLGVAEVILCASPAYIARHGAPQTPDDLVHHCCLNFSSEYLRNRWATVGARDAVEIPIKSAMVSNNGELLRQCAVEAMGIVMRPSFALYDDLATGRLVRVLGDHQFARVAVSMVYPSRRHLPAKLKRFVEFFSQRFPQPDTDPWGAGAAQESVIPTHHRPTGLIAMNLPKDSDGGGPLTVHGANA